MFKQIMNQVLQWTWALPQNILGLFVFIWTKIRKRKSETYKGAIVTRWDNCGGISLGQFIFVPMKAKEDMIKHEYGHHLDSNCLGPLYLFVIGIPSIVWSWCKKYRIKHNLTYYDFYTESRAERLGETYKK